MNLNSGPRRLNLKNWKEKVFSWDWFYSRVAEKRITDLEWMGGCLMYLYFGGRRDGRVGG